ncbi:MAG: O-antigen ligase family protein [Candidatus Jettenia sp.]|nr:O-antigen ligase family protein [Candidatus Jettenia sp.]
MYRKITTTAIGKFGDLLFKSSLIFFVISIPLSIAVNEGAFWLALIGYTINRFSNKKPLFCITGIERPMGIFMLALVLTSLFSINPLYSLSSIGNLRYFLLYLMLASYRLERDFIERLVGLIILMATAWSVYEIFKYFQTQSSRLDIYTAHINTLIIPLIIGLLIMDQIEKRRQAFLLFSLCVLLIASFLSFSRIAWLGTFSSVILVLFYRNWKLSSWFVSMIILAAFVTILYHPDSTTGKLISSIINPFQQGGIRLGSNLERLQMIKDTVSILKKDLLTGIGPDAYKFVSTDKHMRISMDYVQILATSGLVGFSAYAWLIFTFIQRCFLIEKENRKREAFSFYHILSICFFAAFLGFLICGSFEPMFFSSKRLRFIMLLLGMNECLFKFYKHENNREINRQFTTVSHG